MLVPFADDAGSQVPEDHAQVQTDVDPLRDPGAFGGPRELQPADGVADHAGDAAPEADRLVHLELDPAESEVLLHDRHFMMARIRCRTRRTVSRLSCQMGSRTIMTSAHDVRRRDAGVAEVELP